MRDRKAWTDRIAPGPNAKPKLQRAPLAQEEHENQAALFDWADLVKAKHPSLRLMYAIPNGGHRHPAVAAKLKAEGVKKGVLDIHLPVARRGYIGLYIEMKAGKNKPSTSQEWWIEALIGEGHKVVVCWSWEAAKQELLDYLDADLRRDYPAPP